MRTLIMLTTAVLCFGETYFLNTVFPWRIGVSLSLLVAVSFVIMVYVVIGNDKEPLT